MLLLLVNKKKWFLGNNDVSKEVSLLEMELPTVPQILGPGKVLAASHSDLPSTAPLVASLACSKS